MKGYPDEDVRKARKLVSSFIRAAEEVEEVIKLKYANEEFTLEFPYSLQVTKEHA